MKFVLVLVGLVVVMSVVSADDRDAETLRNDANVQPEDYNFSYQTSNGISANEEGVLQNVGTDNEAISARGSYSYTGPDGVVYTVTYIADENGFQPQGAHIPVA